MNEMFMNNYGMFTPAGNKRVKQLIDTFSEKIKDCTPAQAVALMEKFGNKFKKLQYTKTMSEAGDTAVREVFWGGVEKALKANGHGSSAHLINEMQW